MLAQLDHAHVTRILYYFVQQIEEDVSSNRYASLSRVAYRSATRWCSSSCRPTLASCTRRCVLRPRRVTHTRRVSGREAVGSRRAHVRLSAVERRRLRQRQGSGGKFKLLICAGMQGYLHLDIKPSNLIVDHERGVMQVRLPARIKIQIRHSSPISATRARLPIARSCSRIRWKTIGLP